MDKMGYAAGDATRTPTLQIDDLGRISTSSSKQPSGLFALHTEAMIIIDHLTKLYTGFELAVLQWLLNLNYLAYFRINLSPA